MPWVYQHVLFWDGRRGAISLALALSLPPAFAERELLRVMTFGVVLFTLLAQGTTMQLLLRRLGLLEREEAELEYQRLLGRLIGARAARDRVQRRYHEGMLSPLAWEQLAPELERQVATAPEAQQKLLREQPALQAAERKDGWREGLQAQRAMLTTLLHDGVISDEVYEELVTEVDAAIESTPEAAAAQPTAAV